MAPKPRAEIFAERAVELRRYIFDQPTSTFYNNPLALANAIEDFATQMGHMMVFQRSDANAARHQLLLQHPAPRMIVEYGTFVGTSAFIWAAILREIHGEKVPNDVKVYTFDSDPEMVALTRELVTLVGVQDFVHVVQGEGSESLRKLHSQGKVTSIDMAFFDHGEQCYLPSLRVIEELNLWRVGSLALAANSHFPGAPDYLDYLRASGRKLGIQYETDSIHTSRGNCPVCSTRLFSTLEAGANGFFRACSR